MENKKAFWLGILLGVLGVILHSSKAIIVKLVYEYEVDALTMLFFRMLFAFPIYLAIAIFYWPKRSEDNNTFKKQDYFWLAFLGLIGYYLSSYFDFLGLEYIKASLERVILFTYPTIVLFFNRLFLKQRITKPQIYAIIITYLGILVAFGNEVVITGVETVIGGVFILLCAITYAAYLSGSGWLIPKFGVVRFTAFVIMFSSIFVFMHFALVNEKNILHYPWQVYALSCLIATVATVIPSLLVSQAIKMINSSNFAVIASIGPISTIIMASLFLNESLTYLQLFGAAIVIIGVLVVSLKKEKGY